MTAEKVVEFRTDTLYVDAAVGSRELHPLLIEQGVRARIAPKLPADFEVRGSGRNDSVWRCGVERKTLSDLSSSLLMNRFFGTQMPRMLEEYDRIWLLVEGIFRPGADDAIEVMGWDPRTRKVGRRESHVPLTWSQLQGWLLTYDEFGGPKCRRWRTSSKEETVAWLSAWKRWWGKPYHRHSGHIAIENNRPMPSPARAVIRRPNQVQKTAFSLPELGAKSALTVGRHFRSVHQMINASVEEWRKAGLGKKDAQTVYDAIREDVRG